MGIFDRMGKVLSSNVNALLDKAEDPRAALAEALNTPGPCLIHATIDREQFVYPMVPPGGANTEMIGG